MNTQSPVLILCNRVPYPLKDGGALAMHATIKGWFDTGRPVYVLAMNTSRHRVAESSLPALYHQLAGFRMIEVSSDVRLWPALRNFLFSSIPEHAQRFDIPAFATAVADMIREINPGLIQFESIYLAGYLPAIRKQSDALMVQRLHNIEYDVWNRLADETGNPIKAFYLRDLAERIRHYERQVWDDFDLLLPITHSDAQYIIATGCTTPVHTTPFGIEMDHLPEHHPVTPWTAYHLGAMDWLPNQEAMQWLQKDIWPEIRQKSPGFECYIAGRNMPESFFRLQGNGLHCAGEVPDAQAFIADKKILLVPLRSGSGIRVKTLEAMATGKIVISTAIGIQGIEARDGEHYIQANNAMEFADAVHWCLQHPDEAEAIATHARELLHNHYDQRTIMQQLLDFLAAMPND
jgi:polysaccharide biosynthesis protein PslH